MPTPYSDMLAIANALDARDFRGWVFDPGMAFQSPNKWWGDLSRRDFPHEGVDFCFYTDNACRKHRLDAGTRIPAMGDGRIGCISVMPVKMPCGGILRSTACFTIRSITP